MINISKFQNISYDYIKTNTACKQLFENELCKSIQFDSDIYNIDGKSICTCVRTGPQRRSVEDYSIFGQSKLPSNYNI